MAATKTGKRVNYDLLEGDWAAGIKTPRQMAAEYEQATGQKVSHVAIIKHFEKIGLQRDLKGKIRARAEELVHKELTKQAELTPAVRELTIEAVARTQADVILKQRRDVGEAQELFRALLTELKQQTVSLEDLQKLGELMYSPNENGVDKLYDAYQKIISTPGRVSSFKALVEAQKNLVGIERQAFGLSDNANGEADKPKEPEMSPTEAARRVAFMLMRGAQ